VSESATAASVAAAQGSIPLPLAVAVSDACEAVSHNLNGQRLGRKGRYTRERILAATLELLDEDEDEPLTLKSVAERAGLGMSSLYKYFNDLSELVLAVLDPVMATSEDAYMAMLRERWGDNELGEKCLAFVIAYHNFWARHWRLLHLRNAMADQRDRKMMAHRVNSTTPTIALLVRQMDGGEQITAGTQAASMATMAMIGIERSVTIATDRKLPEIMGWNMNPDEQRFVVPGARLLELAIRDTRAAGRS
jgi:AcrR family transcriptional regulator